MKISPSILFEQKYTDKEKLGKVVSPVKSQGATPCAWNPSHSTPCPKPTWDWIVKIEISLIFLLSLSNLNFYKILVKNWTIMKNFMPDFTCMVLQSVIQEKAFLKINFLIAMTSNIFNTQILLNLNFNEDLWNKILL